MTGAEPGLATYAARHDNDPLLTAYDDQLRGRARSAGSTAWSSARPAPVGGLRPRRVRHLPRPRRARGRRLDALIEETIAQFRDETDGRLVRVEVARPRPAGRPRRPAGGARAGGRAARDRDDRRGQPCSRSTCRSPRASSYAGGGRRRPARRRHPDARQAGRSSARSGPSVGGLAGRAEGGDSEFWVAEDDGAGRVRRAARPGPRHRVRASGAARPCRSGGPGSTVPSWPRGRGRPAPRRDLPPLRLHRHVPPDPRTLWAGRGDHDDAVQLDPLTRSRSRPTGAVSPLSGGNLETGVAYAPRSSKIPLDVRGCGWSSGCRENCSSDREHPRAAVR